jgi:flagellar protein FlaG
MHADNTISSSYLINQTVSRQPINTTESADQAKPSGDPQAFRSVEPGLESQAPKNAPAKDATSKESLNVLTKEDEKQVLGQAVKNVNDFFQTVQRTLQFTLNEDTGRMVIQVKDGKTGEVIRQIPPEEMLQLSNRLDELKGLLFEGKA